MNKDSIHDWFGLAGVECVVAGADGLLGNACSKCLSECGARVVGLDMSCKKTVYGEHVSLDITNQKELSGFFDRLCKNDNGGPEWVFVNASYPRTENWGQLDFENVSFDDWNENLKMHLGSAFTFAKEAVRFLKKRKGGSIVNFGSIYGMLGPDMSIYEGTTMKNGVPYSAIKGGIIGLTRYIATVFGKDNIRANVICPGGVKDGQPESFIRAYGKKVPLGRMAAANDIAGTVTFLAGRSARYITGQVLMVDGGWSAW